MIFADKIIKNGRFKKEPSTAELIERGFAPQNGKIDILFIFPPTTSEGREAYHHRPMIPLGIASLAGYLREKGCGVGVLDCPGLRIYTEEIYEIINKKNPAIIAFSTTTYTLDRCAEIAKKVRKNFPNKLTLIGGSHANVAAMETANTYDYFDIISYGLDGEHIIYDLVVEELGHSKIDEKEYDIKSYISETPIKVLIYKYKPKSKNKDPISFLSNSFSEFNAYININNDLFKASLCYNFKVIIPAVSYKLFNLDLLVYLLTIWLNFLSPYHKILI